MAKMWAKFSSWKEALHQTCIRSARVPTKQVAERLGIHENTLGKACNENDPSHLSSKHLPALVQIDGIDLACLDYLNALAGRLIYTVPDDLSVVCSEKMTAEALRRMASVLDTKATALADNAWSTDEAREFRVKVDDLCRCLQSIATYAERHAQQDRPTLKAVNS